MEILLHSIHIEPINYIDLNFDHYIHLETTGSINIRLDDGDRVFEVRRVPVVIQDITLGHIYIAKDEVMGLDVATTWLPGQRRVINLYKEALEEN